MKAIIFDLDDTLAPEAASIAYAFDVVCGCSQATLGVEPEALHQAVRTRARELWHAAPTYDYCMRLGIASWEALVSEFPGPAEDTDLAYLRGWAPAYRHEAWLRALADVGIESADAASQLATSYRRVRFANNPPAADAHEVLRGLRSSGRPMAILTNGPSDLQRQKLAVAELAGFFAEEAIVVSSEVGHGKPEPEVFSCVLERLGVEPGDAIMIGDNPRRDIEGALAVGMDAIWMRNHRDDTLVPPSVPRVDTLSGLAPIISRIEAAR